MTSLSRYHLIEIGGEGFPFKFSVGVLKKFAREKDLSLNDLIARLGDGGVDLMTAFYYAALRAGCIEKNITCPYQDIEEFEDVLDFTDLANIGQKFGEAMPNHSKKKK